MRFAMISERAQRVSSHAGYSLIELLAAMATFSILAAAALPHLNTHRQDLNSVTKQVIGDYRWARTRAITSGVHYAVTWTDTGGYQVQKLKQNADTTWSVDVVVKNVALPSTVARTGSPKTIEFNTRGMVVGNAAIPMPSQTLASFGGTRSIAIWPSGQIDAYQ
jgi:prepilin-type N-terminal cleavage/methylation domain-containing protein